MKRCLAVFAVMFVLADGYLDPHAAAQSASTRTYRGRLSPGDRTLESGEYMDVYTFDGKAGQRVVVNLTSDDFDGYVILVPPRGDQLENDDDEDDPERSVIETDLREAGRYQILVTSYEEGETGAYELNIEIGAARPHPVTTIAFGQTRTGRLSADDPRDDTGKVSDEYAFDADAGDRIALELESRRFDTYLVLVTPDGGEIENDDADGSQDVSRVDLTLRSRGRYRVIVTSYNEQEFGEYALSLRRSNAPSASSGRRDRPVVDETRTGAGRIFGVFVGISDYPGVDNDLDFTADDARRFQQAMITGVAMREADAVLLTDAAATKSRTRLAFEEVSRHAAPDDTFVFFFSGHGDRVKRGTAQSADPDGLDETLSFHDGDVTDDELSQWLAGMRARVSLVVLDSCFSGGFAKDVISAPGRMGLFSSEEDVTSSVADKFRAGGYLARFVAEAIGERKADDDRDGGISALELSQYLHERYRSDVKSARRDADSFVRTSGRETGYQHLVVDRGSIGPYDLLFPSPPRSPR